MATSPAHKFGQAIGNFFESAIEVFLKEIAEKHGLFLDKKGSRHARKKAKKVKWVDKYGNFHDLDFVLERGGTRDKVGAPVAFVEIAWRRYTKHSRNKAQEIQGAILPTAERQEFSKPFLGCVLFGEFTGDAIRQMERNNFRVLCFKYNDVVEAFHEVGVDVRYDEDTESKDVESKYEKWKVVPADAKQKAWEKLLKLYTSKVRTFKDALEKTISREISCILVLPLHGKQVDFKDVESAIGFVENYEEARATGPFMRYEIQVRYHNGDQVNGLFGDRRRAVEFLMAHRTGRYEPTSEELDNSTAIEADEK